MKKNHHNNNPSLRLIVDCASLSIASIDLAVEMAVSVKTQLQVIFIEDEDLLRIAGLPFASEICRSTARQSPMDAEQMQRSLRSRASHFRKFLQRNAQASSITWSFQSISGKATDVGLQTEVEITYTILGQPVSYRTFTRNSPSSRRILVTGNHVQPIKQALKVLLKRFTTEKIEIILLQMEQQNRLSIREFLQKKDPVGHRISIIEPQPEQLRLILSGSDSSFDCAILSRPEDAQIHRKIISNLSCPVILVA